MGVAHESWLLFFSLHTNASVALLSELSEPLCSSTVSSHSDFQAISCPLCWPVWFLPGCALIYAGVNIRIFQRKWLYSHYMHLHYVVFVCAYSLFVHSFYNYLLGAIYLLLLGVHMTRILFVCFMYVCVGFLDTFINRENRWAAVDKTDTVSYSANSCFPLLCFKQVFESWSPMGMELRSHTMGRVEVVWKGWKLI